MRQFHGYCRDHRLWSRRFGFLTTVAAWLLAAMFASADEPPVGGASLRQTAQPYVVPPIIHDKPASTVAYTVDDALAKIREDGLDESAARDLLEMCLKNAISPLTSALDPSLAVQQPADPQRIVWHKGRVVVQTTDVGHQQVKDTLDIIRKYGAAEVAMEIHFVALGEKELKEMLPAATASSVEAPNREGANETHLQPAAFDRPLAKHDGVQDVRAQYLVEQDSPLRWRVMDKKEGDDWLARCRADARSNVLQAPRVTVFNGKTAKVMDVSQSPFVVGVKTVQQLRVPQIRVVSEGTTLELRPLADRSDSIHIDFAVSFSKIRKVETVTFHDASSSEVTIQAPEVATLHLEGGVSLKSGQWVLLAGSHAENLTERQPASVSWQDWLVGSTKSSSAQPAPRLVLMLRAEKLPYHPANGKPASQRHGKRSQAT